jgi:uncharacterized protein (TIGR04255 family)
MAPALGFPEVEHEHLPSAPLRAMLGQIQFAPLPRIADMAGIATFQEAIATSFPDFSPEQQMSVVFGPEGALQSGATQNWRFSTPDRAWSVVLNPGALTLEAAASQYTSYEAFRARFREVWEAALAQLRPVRRLQIGLRYIDHIEDDGPSTEWSSWVRPEVLGLEAHPEIATRIRQSLSDLRLDVDGAVLAFKHGIVQTGPQMNWGYLLDFDYFRQEQTDILATDDVLREFDVFPDEIYAFFRWCVTDEALEVFRRAG